jgi:hypothetical protein
MSVCRVSGGGGLSFTGLFWAPEDGAGRTEGRENRKERDRGERGAELLQLFQQQMAGGFQ